MCAGHGTILAKAMEETAEQFIPVLLIPLPTTSVLLDIDL